MGNQLYWLGPGVCGIGEKRLNPGDPIPKGWPKENFKRFKKKIGEKIETGVIENTRAEIKKLKDEIKKLKDEIKAITAERDSLLQELEEIKRNSEGGEE